MSDLQSAVREGLARLTRRESSLVRLEEQVGSERAAACAVAFEVVRAGHNPSEAEMVAAAEVATRVVRGGVNFDAATLGRLAHGLLGDVAKLVKEAAEEQAPEDAAAFLRELVGRAPAAAPAGPPGSAEAFLGSLTAGPARSGATPGGESAADFLGGLG